MRQCGAALLLAALIAAACSGRGGGGADAAVLAVDLGSETLKLALVTAGRIPIAIVINEMSKRKTPALVAFVDGDRLVGEEAASMAVRYPDRVYARLIDLLGRPAGDPALAAQLKAAYRPYEVVSAPNRTSPAAAAVRPGGEGSADVYSAEEVVGSLLEYAKGLAEAANGGAPVTDAVLTVPASFTPQQRQALLDAAKLAGLNVMGLVHNHAAAALQYGIERDFTNRTEMVVLYDLGAASLQAALVTYSAYTNPKGGSTSQFEVRDVVWRDNLGGEHLELVLMEHFADEFNAAVGGGRDVRTAPRAMAKLRRQVARTKHILSANTEASLSVEEMWLDRDFKATISREKFEALAGNFWARAVEPVTELLSRNNLTAADLTAIELLGGTSRVPRIKQALSDALGGRALDMHLDADEATVLGAALWGANLSTTFRLRQFGMADKTPFSVAIQLEGEAAPKTLVPAMRKMPTKRGVHLHNLTVDSVAFSLDFDNAPGTMPDCHRAFHLGDFSLSGVHAVIAKYNESGKVSIHTRVDASGLFHVDKADAGMEVWEEVPPPPPPPADDNTTAADGKDGGDGKDGNKKDGKDAPAPAPAEPPQLRKRVLRVPLNLTGGFVAPGMNKTELDASRRVMRRLRAADNAKRETAKARNDLEAYVIATLDKVSDSEEVAGVTTEEQRDAFRAQLTELEDWLYEEGEAVGADEYRAQLRKVREVGDKIFARVEEAKNRPQIIKLAADFVELTRKAVNTWPEVKPWLGEEEVKALLAKVDEFTAWLEGKQAEQGKRAAHDDPAFRVEEVSAALLRLQKDFNRLSNKRKPRPPPPPPEPATDANATDAQPPAGEPAQEEQAQGEQPEQQQAEEKEELDHDELRRRRQ